MSNKDSLRGDAVLVSSAAALCDIPKNGYEETNAI